MNLQQKLQWLAYAAERRPEFLAQFIAFCQRCGKGLTDNPQFPGITFSADDCGDVAHLSIFGQGYVIRVHLLSVSVPSTSDHMLSGVIAVAVPHTHAEEELVWLVFIDQHGNVRRTPTEVSSLYNVNNTEFISVFLTEISDLHFARLNAKFIGSPSASR